MIDVFNDILKLYKTAFTTLSVPSYSGAIPFDTPDTYVIYHQVFSTEAETKQESGQDATMQVSIIDNNAFGTFSKVNDIATEIFQAIHPNSYSNLSDERNIFTRITQDRAITMALKPNVQVQRIIHFTHNFLND